MDLSTLLMRVDQRRYPMLAAYMADLRSIATATQQYWAGEARGAREVSSRALLSVATLHHHQCQHRSAGCCWMHALPIADGGTAGAAERSLSITSKAHAWLHAGKVAHALDGSTAMAGPACDP